MAQSVIKKPVPAVGELFTVKLKGDSIYIVDPFPNVDTPVAKIARGSCENVKHDGDTARKNIRYLQFYTTIITTTSLDCKLKLRVEEDDSRTSVMTFLRVRKKVELSLTSSWQEVTLGKGNWAVLRLDDDGSIADEMKAEIDISRISSCISVDDGETAGIWESVYNQDGQEKYGISNLSSWYRIVRKECTLWLRSLNGNSGTLTLLKLPGKPGTLE